MKKNTIDAQIAETIANDEAAAKMYGRIVGFMPVDKEVVVRDAAKAMQGIIKYSFISHIRHGVNFWPEIRKELEVKVTSTDMIDINSNLRMIDSIADLKNGKIVGPMKITEVITRMMDEDKSSDEDIVKQMVENFPNEIAMVGSYLGAVLTNSVAEFMELHEPGTRLDLINIFLNHLDAIPVEAYQIFLERSLDEQIKGIAKTAMLYVEGDESEEEPTRIELRAKKKIINALMSLNPNSGKNAKIFYQMERAFDKLFNRETFKELIDFLMKPANETMENAIKKLKAIENGEADKAQLAE